jgi:hypothetical protein
MTQVIVPDYTCINIGPGELKQILSVTVSRWECGWIGISTIIEGFDCN